MQGDYLRGLRIVAEKKGWDPTKILVTGETIQPGLPDREKPWTGDVSLEPFPAPAPDNAVYDNPALTSSVDWADPGEKTNTPRHTNNANPYPGMPGAR